MAIIWCAVNEEIRADDGSAQFHCVLLRLWRAGVGIKDGVVFE